MTLRQKVIHRLTPSLHTPMALDLEQRFELAPGALHRLVYFGALDDNTVRSLATALQIRE